MNLIIPSKALFSAFSASEITAEYNGNNQLIIDWPEENDVINYIVYISTSKVLMMKKLITMGP